MLKRTITTIVSIAVLLPVLYLSHTILFPIAIACVTLLALFEMFCCLGCVRNIALTLPFYIAGALSPFAVRYIRNGMGKGIGLSEVAVLAIIFLMLYIFALIVLSKKETSITDAGIVFFTSLYIVFAFSGIIYLRDFENEFIYLLIFIGAWSTDIFAYLSGMLLGRHKLIPKISPKKTVEGSIGGTLLATAAFALASYLIGIQDIGWLIILACGVIISIIAQLGDLSMSAIKRQRGIKDFGSLFPGHGGVLDRFDSILAVSSVMTLLFALINMYQ